MEQASEKDVEPSTVRQCVIRNEWSYLPAAYHDVKQDLSEFAYCDTIKSARASSREGHFGITKMKMCLRESVVARHGW